MESLMLCLSGIVPILIMAALGYGAKRAGFIRQEDVPRANKWAFAVLMPLMCFYNIYTSDLNSALRPKLIVFTVIAIFVIYALSFGYSLLFVKERFSRSVVIQGLFRSNFVILGLPLAAGLVPDGDIGVAAVMGAIVVPIYNVLAVITLEAYNGEKISARKLLLNIVRNPLILGSVAGILFLALHIQVPEILLKPVRDFGKAASPIMLFLLGAFFSFNIDTASLRRTLAVCIGRLIVVPALVFTAALLLGFRGIELVTLLAIFASPTAVASFTMADQLGGDAKLAGNIVVLTSFLSAFTLFGWSYLLKVLNFY